MDKGSERSTTSSEAQSYTARSLDSVIAPHVHRHSVVQGTSVLEHMSALTARAKTARAEDPIHPEDPIMRGVRLCDEGTPLISDAAQKNPISKAGTILRSHFPVCLTVDPAFAKGISFLGQRRLHAYRSTSDRANPNHSPCKHVESSPSSSTVGRVRSQSRPQSRPQSGMTSRSASTTSTRDTENRLSGRMQSKFKDWIEEVFKTQPETRSELLRRKLALADLAKGGQKGYEERRALRRATAAERRVKRAEEELEEQRTVAEEGRASNNGSFKSADSRAVSPQICTEVLISIA